MLTPPFYIGLMSGTSVDAVDAVLLSLHEGKPTICCHSETPIPGKLRQDILDLNTPETESIDLLGRTDRAIGLLFADAALDLIKCSQLQSGAITAIGSHGQTVRHRPQFTNGDGHAFSLQIGDPNTIAAATGITVVSDFRRKDVALGGEGAPLVPAFHRAVFQHPSQNRAIVNIGGIANLTWLPALNCGGPVIGFDTGPGNCLIDGWIAKHRGQAFDDRGLWAASGSVNDSLLEALMKLPYLETPPPKSTGRELFNLPWLDAVLASLEGDFSPVDVQATLTYYTARTIAQSLAQIPGEPPVDEIYLCGGGASNTRLVDHLRQLLPTLDIHSTARLGIDPKQVEAAAFAWLAHQTLNGLPGSLASVTGARRDSVLGGIYYP